MTPRERFSRRFKIATVVVVFLASVGTFLYFSLRTDPTCSDGRKNGGEAGVDCGGRCAACPEVLTPEPFSVREAAVMVGASPSEYDAIIKVYNPNDTIGASSVGYDLVLRDAAGAEIGRTSGTDSVLPQETKVILAIGIAASGAPASVSVTFRDAAWERFSGYQERPRLSVYRTGFNRISSGAFYGEAVGTLRNDSPYDFRTVTVKVVLRDADGRALSVNSTDMNTFLSGDVRDFTLRWPSSFPGEVASVEAVADTDFYHEDNFISRYLDTAQRFQNLR